MNEIEILRRFSVAAHKERQPVPDVRRAVLQELAARDAATDRPLSWLAGLSVVAAVPAVIAGFMEFQVLANPFLPLVLAFGWTLT